MIWLKLYNNLPYFRQLTVHNRLQTGLGASFNGFIEVTKWVKQKGVNSLSKGRHWGPWRWTLPAAEFTCSGITAPVPHRMTN